MKLRSLTSVASAPVIHASSPGHFLNFEEIKCKLAYAPPTPPAVVTPAALLTRVVRPLLALTALPPTAHPELPFMHLLPAQQRQIRFLRWHLAWSHVELQEKVERVLSGDPLRYSHRFAPDFVRGIDISPGDDPPKNARPPRPSEVRALPDAYTRMKALLANSGENLTQLPWRPIAEEIAAWIGTPKSPEELAFVSRLEHGPAPQKLQRKPKAGPKPARQTRPETSLFNLFAAELAAPASDATRSPEPTPGTLKAPEAPAPLVEPPDQPSPPLDGTTDIDSTEEPEGA
jgi:hypothetical protein